MQKNRVLSYGAAIHEALVQEMELDPGVFVLGQGVDDAKGMYGTTLGLNERFGNNRCFDVPLAEDGVTGIMIGASMAGMRPVNVHQRMDFLLLCMNQLINIAAKQSYVFSGQSNIPIVVRGIVGRSWGQGAQHSQSFHSYFMHVPGIKIFAPVTPHDAKGCMIAAIRDNNPVLIMEHRMLYGNQGFVPLDSYEVDFGKARILRDGKDVTILAISHMVVEAVRAANLLNEIGLSAEIIDPVSLAPLDIDTIIASVQKTKNLLVVDNGWVNCGAAAEIVAQVTERLQGSGNIKLARMGFAPVPCPTTKPLESLFYPNSRTIALKAHEIVTGETNNWFPKTEEAKEIAEFRGPF
ncbi:alpha-ketoacid dehydrogenase subunit beta [Alphaproteobacteria bacterium]|nr:alpha-ketoacid dehydrogenase subunit beta [Alphaproteobacteria bacterium]